ncbi:hypothetical protein CBS147337_10471 [Penicillium roqueforti]|nr:hypothetical protein CBS147337_10471 [Penicillium roqueforti]
MVPKDLLHEGVMESIISLPDFRLATFPFALNTRSCKSYSDNSKLMPSASFNVGFHRSFSQPDGLAQRA